MVNQISINLPSYSRGYHIITSLIESKLPVLPETGILSLFIHHTSAALSINENADPTVRIDFESFINKLVPEDDPVYQHIYEGSDDMPAHLKSSLLGQEISIPITSGKLNLGIWQGIYLCEFRNRSAGRRVTATIIS